MRIVEQPAYISFTGNPIVFSLEVENEKPVFCNVNISVDDKPYNFDTRVFPTQKEVHRQGQIFKFYYVTTNLASLLQSVAEPIREGISSPFNPSPTNAEIEYTVRFEQGTDTFSFEKKIAILGGIPNHLFLKYKENGTDIFSTHFLNSSKQRLFTNRYTNNDDTKIEYYESELDKVWFYRLEGKEYKIKGSNGNEHKVEGIGRFGCIDLLETYQLLQDNTLSFYVDDTSMTQIIINDDPACEEKYILKFRNSFGFMERLLVSEKTKYTPTLIKSEPYKRYDGYIPTNRQSRATFQSKYKSNLGYKKIKHISLIQDLLLSEEVYWIDLTNDTQQLVSVNSNFDMSQKGVEPESVLIEINGLNSDKFTTSLS